MIKKQQTRSLYATYQIISFKQLLKKTFKPNKEKPNTIEKNLRNVC